jgi:hypothetical protein
MFYSKTTSGFYPADLREAYEAAGTWPADAMEIGSEKHAELIEAQNTGAQIKADANGMPVAVMPAPPTVEQIRESALIEIRAQRAPIMSVLDGIAGRAARSGDTALAAAADSANQALRDITADPAFLAAQTLVDMNAAILARYRAIADVAPVDVRTALREVIGD